MVVISGSDSKRRSSPWKDFVSGSCGGVADMWACHGLDRIKTHIQNHPHLTFTTATREIWGRGGLRAVYEGIWPATAEAVFKVGLRFYTYEWSLRFYKDCVTDPTPFAAQIFGGFVSGSAESLAIVIPCQLLKVRHMTQGDRHMPFHAVMRHIVKEEGMSARWRWKCVYMAPHHVSYLVRISVVHMVTWTGVRALYTGGVTTYLRQTSNHMIRFPVYYGLAGWWTERNDGRQLSNTEVA
jgi:hypothetical protein